MTSFQILPSSGRSGYARHPGTTNTIKVNSTSAIRNNFFITATPLLIMRYTTSDTNDAGDSCYPIAYHTGRLISAVLTVLSGRAACQL